RSRGCASWSGRSVRSCSENSLCESPRRVGGRSGKLFDSGCYMRVARRRSAGCHAIDRRQQKLHVWLSGRLPTIAYGSGLQPGFTNAALRRPPRLLFMHGKTLALIGAGNMAEAILKGLLRSGTCAPEAIIATARRPERVATLRAQYGVTAHSDNASAVAAADVVVLSVKPQVLDGVLVEIAPSLRPDTLVLSIAAGFPLSAIAQRLGAQARLVRAMPNTPSLVGAG